jgi:hypothetical protein
MNFNPISIKKTCTTNNRSDKKYFPKRLAIKYCTKILKTFSAKGILVFQQNI